MKKFFLATISLLLLSCTAYGGLYRWVDDKGNVFYSDKIPPKASKHGHIELNQRGLRKKTRLSLARLKELKAIKKQREEELEEKTQKAKKDTLKKMQDEQLLAIYSSREELVNVFNSKLKMSKLTIKILKIRHKKLSERFAKIEIKYEKMKNPAFRQTLTGKIDDMLDGLKVYQQAITENIVEQDKLEKRFAKDLKRYDKLVLSDQLIANPANTSKAFKKAMSTDKKRENNSEVSTEKKSIDRIKLTDRSANIK
jgi:hypothetical protein